MGIDQRALLTYTDAMRIDQRLLYSNQEGAPYVVHKKGA
jgi:hypothetical protein